jgi:hypothetical protein
MGVMHAGESSRMSHWAFDVDGGQGGCVARRDDLKIGTCAVVMFANARAMFDVCSFHVICMLVLHRLSYRLSRQAGSELVDSEFRECNVFRCAPLSFLSFIAS